jgi:hypothetical protein
MKSPLKMERLLFVPNFGTTSRRPTPPLGAHFIHCLTFNIINLHLRFSTSHNRQLNVSPRAPFCALCLF